MTLLVGLEAAFSGDRVGDLQVDLVASDAGAACSGDGDGRGFDDSGRRLRDVGFPKVPRLHPEDTTGGEQARQGVKRAAKIGARPRVGHHSVEARDEVEPPRKTRGHHVRDAKVHARVLPAGSGDERAIEVDAPHLAMRVARQCGGMVPRRAADVENASREPTRLGPVEVEHFSRFSIEVTEGIELVVERCRSREHLVASSFGSARPLGPPLESFISRRRLDIVEIHEALAA